MAPQPLCPPTPSASGHGLYPSVNSPYPHNPQNPVGSATGRGVLLTPPISSVKSITKIWPPGAFYAFFWHGAVLPGPFCVLQELPGWRRRFGSYGCLGARFSQGRGYPKFVPQGRLNCEWGCRSVYMVHLWGWKTIQINPDNFRFFCTIWFTIPVWCGLPFLNWLSNHSVLYSCGCAGLSDCGCSLANCDSFWDQRWCVYCIYPHFQLMKSPITSKGLTLMGCKVIIHYSHQKPRLEHATET